MNTQIIFVADLFAEDYEGGAELTTKALIDSSKIAIKKIKASHVTVEFIKEHQNDYWLFGNFASINFNLIPAIVGNVNYSVLEYDYKFCNYRSIEKHKATTGKDCDCADSVIGKYVSAFYYGADHIFWMSEGQRDRYHSYFPYLKFRNQTVLSSVFDQDFFNTVDFMKSGNDDRSGWIVLGSDSWIKGKNLAIKWCQDNSKNYEVVWNLPYADLLSKLASAEGFVYLPLGGDTCPRMVIEAKLLGCEVIVNDNVQHSNEKWWQGSPDDVCDYLKGRPRVFWSIIEKYYRRNLGITGCVVTQDSMSLNEPFIESIETMLELFESVVVVDAGSNDDTTSALDEIAKDNSRLHLKKSHSRDLDTCWKLARDACKSDLIWLSRPDEVIDDNHSSLINVVVSNLHKSHQNLAMPLITYKDEIQTVDMTPAPWKITLIRNYPHITLKYENDTLDVINSETGDKIQLGTFFGQDAEDLHKNAQLSEIMREKYLTYLDQVTQVLPTTRKYRIKNA